jgi:AraC-like DNA-binding protein
MWRRMALVMRALAEGSDLTAAALACGFASSAHLSAAFKQMFGLSPREVLALRVAIDTSEDRVPVDRPPASAR